MYLFVAGTMFAFTACGGGETATEETAVEEVVACADDCQKACCLGCKATEGEASCHLLAADDHSCCVKEEADTAEVHGDHDHDKEAATEEAVE